MSFDRVPAGKDVPNDCNVVIEIPMRADPIKYEVDKETGAVFVDRFMSTAMHYPCNYGYIPQTLSGDGDPCDVLVLSPVPLMTLTMPLFAKAATRWLKPPVSRVAPGATVWKDAALNASAAPARKLPAATAVAPV